MTTLDNIFLKAEQALNLYNEKESGHEKRMAARHAAHRLQEVADLLSVVDWFLEIDICSDDSWQWSLVALNNSDEEVYREDYRGRTENIWAETKTAEQVKIRMIQETGCPPFELTGPGIWAQRYIDGEPLEFYSISGPVAEEDIS